MDIFMKTLSGAILALLISLTLSGTGKNFSMLLGLLTCCLITAVAMAYLEPVTELFQQLEEMIPLDNGLLNCLMKMMGIGLVGEIASMICADSGNSAMGKTLQLLTTIVILWMALPLIQTLLDMIRGVLNKI